MGAGTPKADSPGVSLSKEGSLNSEVIAALTAEEAAAGTSIGAAPREFMDVFSKLALRRNLFDFPNLSDEERQYMESLVGGRTGLREAGLYTMSTMERVLTVPADISEMSNESFHRHLALVSQMAFNVLMMYATSRRYNQKTNLGSNTWTGSMSREGRKKRRLSSDECEDTNLEDMNMLKSQLQAQNTSCKLDREQRTGHNDSLVSALNKLTDALVKIADNGSKQRDVNEASYIVVEHYDIC
ncbi:hypothetical protein POTOM_042295 [Populus tomentosa]|uniref:Uncharacterized protein n=1 Tax=Populus tomentosa TaxID=118781 RepID=A0A8X7YRB2_POPTO|nr:hypothetical protein POTOM_042295 [Populus tomentosa]